jgi:phage terminase small subunit
MNDGSKPLTNVRHENFARAVASGETKTKAYADAGYALASAASQGSILSRRPEVKARITYLKHQIGIDLERELIDTKRDHERTRINELEARTRAIITRLETEMNGEGPDTHSSARVAAAMNLAKLIGLSNEQLEHTGGMQIEVIYADQQPNQQED